MDTSSKEITILRQGSISPIPRNNPPPLLPSVAKQGGVCCECVQIPKFPPCGGQNFSEKPNFWMFQSKWSNKIFSAFGRNFFFAKQGGVSGEGGGGLVARITTDSSRHQ